MSALADVNGIVLLDKPLGLSSAGAVARVKRLFAARKAGHTGSLDPLASGLLPICCGEATKFGAQMLDADKTYRVVARLGQRTASADLESAVIETRALPQWTSQQMAAALEAFPRDYLQVPPMYSAIKQDGRPLYEYARAGVTRERESRRVEIREMTFLSWDPPDLQFDVRCSKGAYIRVLAEDIAASVGTLAHLTGLRRLGVAPFDAAVLWSFEQLEALDLEGRRRLLLPVDSALGHLRRIDLPDGQVAALRQGQTVEAPVAAPETVRIYANGLGFLGLGEMRPPGRLVPLRLISALANRA